MDAYRRAQAEARAARRTGFRNYLPPDLEPLTSSFRLISYDQRGSGHSTAVTDPTLLTAPAACHR